jgi:proteasome lid subunit RPN8/RPN11
VCDRRGLESNSSKHASVLAVSKKVRGKLIRDAWECSKTQKCILDGAWLRVFILIDGAPPNKFNALTLVEQHIPISNPELCELLISHWHREHIINVYSTIKDVFRSEIWTLRSRRIYGQCLTGDDHAFLPNRTDFPILRYNADLGMFVAGFHSHTASLRWVSRKDAKTQRRFSMDEIIILPLLPSRSSRLRVSLVPIPW